MFGDILLFEEQQKRAKKKRIKVVAVAKLALLTLNKIVTKD